MKHFILAGAALLISFFPGAQEAQYHVYVTADKKVKVSARFPLSNDTVFIFMRGATRELPEGEAGFVKNLQVNDAAGKPVISTYAGEGNWKLTGVKKGETVDISYDLQTTHKQYNWNHVGGPDEAAFTNDDGLFFTGYTLFIVPGLELQPVGVEFHLPEGWKASTPWQRKEGNRFIAESARFLLNNCLMLGTHAEHTVSLKGMEMRVAMTGKIAYAMPLVKKTMERLIPACQELFNGSPAPAYLVAMSDERMTDGSAFRRSFSQIFADTIDEKGMATWAYIMAHEIFHLWNGHAIRPDGQEEWFKEGFTDYMTNVLLRRTGLIDDEIMKRKLENMARRYWLDRFWQRDTLSIRETGDHKEQLRFGVYGGGAVVAIALESEMRKATGNKKGVADLMRALYDEFGKTGKPYSLPDIIRVCRALSGKDLQPFFDRFVTGREWLDLAPYLKEMGLDFRTVLEEVYVTNDSKAGPAQKDMYRSIFIR